MSTVTTTYFSALTEARELGPVMFGEVLREVLAQERITNYPNLSAAIWGTRRQNGQDVPANPGRVRAYLQGKRLPPPSAVEELIAYLGPSKPLKLDLEVLAGRVSVRSGKIMPLVPETDRVHVHETATRGMVYLDIRIHTPAAVATRLIGELREYERYPERCGRDPGNPTPDELPNPRPERVYRRVAYFTNLGTARSPRE